MSTPRILHVTETLVGGVATYLDILLRDQLRRYGSGQIALVCPRQHRGNLARDLADAVQVFEYDAGRGLGGLMALFARVRSVDHQWRADVVHLHSSFAGAFGRLALGQPARRVIYNPHGWAFTMTTLPPWQARLYARVERALLGRCATVIAVSDSEYREAVSAGLEPARIRVVRSGLPPLAEIPEKTPPPRIRLLFAGRASAQKGLDWLLDIMRGVPDLPVDLHIFGASPDECGVVPANVHVAGWRPFSEVLAAFATADALIMPSRWEAFGFSALEAMRAGVAVLASDRGALPELVVDGQTGALFPLERPDVLVGLLRTTSRETYHAWGNAALRRQRAQFDAGAMCDGIDAVYRQVA